MESLPTTTKAVKVLEKDQPAILTDSAIPSLGPNEVLVKMEYGTINPSDLGAMKGNYPGVGPLPYTIGFEGSGVIIAVGSNLKIPHKVGDRVAVVNLGVWSNYVVADSDWLFLLPEDVSFEDAAAHFINPWTVYLMEKVIKEGGHKAVIHSAAASALGKMLIKKLKQLDIKLINLVRREGLIKEVESAGGENIINTASENWQTELSKLAKELNATICLDAVAAEMSGELLDILPTGSILYVYARLGGADVTGITVKQLLFEGKTLKGLWLWPWAFGLNSEEKAKVGKEVLSEIKSVYKTEVNKVFKLEEFQTGIEHYLVHRSEGKTLLKLN